MHGRFLRLKTKMQISTMFICIGAFATKSSEKWISGMGRETAKSSFLVATSYIEFIYGDTCVQVCPEEHIAAKIRKPRPCPEKLLSLKLLMLIINQVI